MNLPILRAPLALRPTVVGAALAVAALAAVSSASAQVRLSAISPFLPGPSAAAAAGGAPEEYELAGASATSTAAEVCIYDARSKHSRWIAVGATEAGIQVVSYDAANDLAVVRVNGVQKLLAERKATVAASAPAPAAPPSVVASVNDSNTSNPVSNQPPLVNPAEAGKSPEVVKQEKEARMLVSDLLEIGLQQRKAYEEAQKKAGNGG